MTAASGREVFRRLHDAQVRFLVVGGLAVNVHGLARMTLDLDIVVDLTAGNVERAFDALGRAGYAPVVPVSAAALADPDRRASLVREKHMQVLRFHSDRHPLTPVDFFVTSPFPFEEEYERAVVRDVAGVGGVRIVRLDTLIAMKRAAGRPQDLADVAALELRRPRRDRA